MANEKLDDGSHSDEENHDNNTPKPAEENNPPGDFEIKVLELKVNYNGEEIKFKIKQNVKFSKLFQKYCVKMNLDPHVVRFLYDQERILNNHTPAFHEMKDGDEITVFLKQDGGAKEIISD